MTVKEIMSVLAAKGSDSIKRILLKHGVKEPLFGVKVEELKKLQKIIKKDYQLAKDLYATGNADAMYLAGLIADDKLMTSADLHDWLVKAHSTNIRDYTVPWVTAESNHGYALALEWIKSGDPVIATAGWQTLGMVVSLKPDAELDLAKIEALLEQVKNKIHTSPGRVAHGMNAFISSAGIYIASLTKKAIATANSIGTITVDKDGDASAIPSAAAQIQKAVEKGNIGKKKKTVKC